MPDPICRRLCSSTDLSDLQKPDYIPRLSDLQEPDYLPRLSDLQDPVYLPRLSDLQEPDYLPRRLPVSGEAGLAQPTSLGSPSCEGYL